MVYFMNNPIKMDDLGPHFRKYSLQELFCFRVSWGNKKLVSLAKKIA